MKSFCRDNRNYLNIYDETNIIIIAPIVEEEKPLDLSRKRPRNQNKTSGDRTMYNEIDSHKTCIRNDMNTTYHRNISPLENSHLCSFKDDTYGKSYNSVNSRNIINQVIAMDPPINVSNSPRFECEKDKFHNFLNIKDIQLQFDRTNANIFSMSPYQNKLAPQYQMNADYRNCKSVDDYTFSVNNKSMDNNKSLVRSKTLDRSKSLDNDQSLDDKKTLKETCDISEFSQFQAVSNPSKKRKRECHLCNSVFTSKFEYGMHYLQNHSNI